jgi:hypothetical protein
MQLPLEAKYGIPTDQLALLHQDHHGTVGMSGGMDHPAGESEFLQTQGFTDRDVRLCTREGTDPPGKSSSEPTTILAFQRVPAGMGVKPSLSRVSSDWWTMILQEVNSLSFFADPA